MPIPLQTLLFPGQEPEQSLNCALWENLQSLCLLQMLPKITRQKMLLHWPDRNAAIMIPDEKVGKILVSEAINLVSDSSKKANAI